MKKFLCFCIASLIVIPLFAAGGGQKPSTASEARPKLTYWENLDRAANGHKSFATHPVFMEMQKRLGIDLEFRSPPLTNVTEAFNLMVTSRDLPDIITYDWFDVPGGAANYIRDDVILPLDDIFDKYAPTIKKVLQLYPNARRESSLDDGTHYCFPQIYTDPYLQYSFGPMFRRDLLNKIPAIDGSKVPMDIETLDDWEQLLLAVKNSGLKGTSGRDIIPLSVNGSVQLNNQAFIVGAFGITTRFTQDKGKVVYGPADPRYFDYLTLMKRWYDLGILDHEFAANTAQMLDEKVLDNRVFFMAHNMGNGITRYTGLARATNPDFQLNTARWPVLTKGGSAPSSRATAGLTDFTRWGAAITTACKNVAAAAKFLDYAYTDDGYILTNFGIEGVTFNWDTSIRPETKLIFSTHAGYPKYTDLIMKNPDYTPDVAMSVYVTVNNMTYGYKGREFLDQRDGLPEQVGPRGRELWTKSDDSIGLPAVTPTVDESAEFGRLMTDINTYTDEMTIKFITGAAPLTQASFNDYVQTQRQMNLDRAITLMQAQLDRYNKRP